MNDQASRLAELATEIYGAKMVADLFSEVVASISPEDKQALVANVRNAVLDRVQSEIYKNGGYIDDWGIRNQVQKDLEKRTPEIVQQAIAEVLSEGAVRERYRHLIRQEVDKIARETVFEKTSSAFRLAVRDRLTEVLSGVKVTVEMGEVQQ